jgi:hypothetical protein
MILNREGFLKETELKKEIVSLENGDVIVSEMSAEDYLELCQLCKLDGSDKEGSYKLDVKKFNPGLVAFCVVDEKGDRIFLNEDIPLLSKRSQKQFSKIILKAQQLNGLIGDEGNDSEPTQTGSNSGESQQPSDIGTLTS